MVSIFGDRHNSCRQVPQQPGVTSEVFWLNTLLKAGLIRAERGDYVHCGSVWNSSKETLLLEVSLESKSLFVNYQVANFINNIQCHIGTCVHCAEGLYFQKT